MKYIAVDRIKCSDIPSVIKLLSLKKTFMSKVRDIIIVNEHFTASPDAKIEFSTPILDDGYLS